MALIDEYEIHPDCAIWPEWSEERLQLLAQDIEENGLVYPILVDHTGTVLLDGRQRLLACEIAGIFPPTKRWPEGVDPWPTIYARNYYNKEVSASQAAAISLVRLERVEAEAAKRRTRKPANTDSVGATWHQQNRAPRSADILAEGQHTSGRTVARVKRVQEEAPDLLEQIIDGTLDAGSAEKIVKQRAKVKAQPPADKPEPVTQETTVTFYKDGKELLVPKPKKAAEFNDTSGPGISWARYSWNPVTGCDHGCDYCYARDIATNPRTRAAFPAGFTPLFRPERLVAPANTKLGTTPADRRVFVCSMADLFGKWVPDHWINQVFKACHQSPEWTYLFLTKFPSRYEYLDFPKNSWVGCSVDSQRRVNMAELAMAKVDAQVRWLSIEPLLEEVTFTSLKMFDWIVIGAQTAQNGLPAFAPNIEWVANLIVQARADGVPIHLKPNLLTQPGMQLLNEYPNV